jgi:predicted alpha/beta-hydrolase family hydrolase
MLAAAKAVESTGAEVLRFNFPYRDRGARLPDPVSKLIPFFAETAQKARKRDSRLIIGGRSMGGRVASMLAAEGFECDGLLLIAYPLHPAGKPEKLRDAHLPSIEVPVLCFNGTRDELCRRDLMEQALKKVRTRWDMRWIEGADHALRTKKAQEAIAVGVGEWLATI